MTRIQISQLISAALSSRVVVTVLLALTGIAVWWSWTFEVHALLAVKGFSPIGWIYKSVHPGNFLLDFPGGIENYRLSAFMHVYTAAHAIGMSPESLLPVVIAFEIALLSFAVFALARVLAPDAPLIVAALVVVYTVASPARDMNLANFPQPYILGQYYNVADALRILGIVMVLKGRLVIAALLLGGSFATHPTMGLMGVICAAAMQLARPRELRTRSFAAAAGVFFVIAAAWLFVQFRSATISGGQIPLSNWLEMTRALNGHWYTFDNGFFTTNPGKLFLPFLSFLLLLAYYWPRGSASGEVTSKALAGILTMLVLAVAGVAISALVPAPFLIKLALHRANDLIIYIGMVYVVHGLWRDLTAEPWWRRTMAATALVSPWFVRPFPLLVSAVLALPACLRVLGSRDRSSADWVVTTLIVVAAGLAAVYVAFGIPTGLNPLWYFHERAGLLVLIAFLCLCLITARWLGRGAVQALVLVVMIGSLMVYLKDRHDGRDLALDRDYLRAQIWARENTRPTALFMSDPTINYGWRDYSRRSSFGSLREWLHTSWLYDSSFERYQEGLRRLREFDIDLQAHLRSRPPIAAMRSLSHELRSRYYGASDDWRIDLARRYGIDFFVFQRKLMVAPTSLKIVYQNDYFVICASGR
jgi:hypothetical protein